MATEWAGLVNTTITQYLKGSEDHTMRDRVFLSMLKKHGGISYGNSGLDFQWQAEALQPTVEAYGDGGLLTYSKVNKYRTLKLDYRGYTAQDMVTLKEREMNKGNEALINRFSTIGKDLKKAMDNKLGEEFYVDGNAAGNENRLHGLESFFATGTTVAADRLAKPDDSYGGKDTDVAQLSATWSTALAAADRPNANIATDWPEGSGDSGYDWNSPKVINYTSSSWGTGSTTWADNCTFAIRQGHCWSRLTGGKSGVVDLVMLAGKMYYEYLNKAESKQRIMITPSATLKELGFDGVQQEGIQIIDEYGIPAGDGYGINFDEMELKCLEDQLFVPEGPDWDPRYYAWLFSLHFFGNMKMNPRAHFKLDATA